MWVDEALGVSLSPVVEAAGRSLSGASEPVREPPDRKPPESISFRIRGTESEPFALRASGHSP